MLTSLHKNIMTNRVMGLQNIQISKKVNHTLMHQDVAVILLDTPGYIFLSLYFPNPDHYLFLELYPYKHKIPSSNQSSLLTK